MGERNMSGCVKIAEAAIDQSPLPGTAERPRVPRNSRERIPKKPELQLALLSLPVPRGAAAFEHDINRYESNAKGKTRIL
jgi:hypothetical protein